jgi:hypothetical protein
MARFSKETRDRAFARSKGQCECRRQGHNHNGRCPKVVYRTTRVAFHLINRSMPSTLSNCEVLCIRCHRKTRSYGRPKP